MNALKRCLAFLLLSGSSSLAPAPRPSGTPAAMESTNPRAKANAQNVPSLARRPGGRAPSFSSQDLTHLVQNELAPKPWLPPTLSFRTDFPKTAAAVKGSVKASVAAVDELKNSMKKSVEAIPIYRSIQSKARRARNTVVERRRPPSPSRTPGLTSQDVAALVERELPSAKAKD